MNQKSYVICATHGEYDDFTRIPIFVCNTFVELELFISALNNKEHPYWDNVVDFFFNYYGCVQDRDHCVPDDIGFSWHEVGLLTLNEQSTLA